jgi:sulfite exporter TauE/SafE
MEKIELGTIFVVALLGSFGHCVGMCGGFVIAYSTAKIDRRWRMTRQLIAHLLYSMGRIASYMAIGALFGYLGQKIAFTPASKGALFIVIGFLMTLIGLSLIGKLKFLNSIESSIAQSSWFGRLFRHAIHARTLSSFFVMGVLNGLIPCGLVYFFATAAIVAGSAIKGAIVMAVFGVATIPALLAIGLFSSMMAASRHRNLIINLAAALVILFGFFTAYKGYMMIDHPDQMKRKMQELRHEMPILPTPHKETHAR